MLNTDGIQKCAQRIVYEISPGSLQNHFKIVQHSRWSANGFGSAIAHPSSALDSNNKRHRTRVHGLSFNKNIRLHICLVVEAMGLTASNIVKRSTNNNQHQ